MLFLVSCAVKMVDTVQCRMFPVVSQSGQRIWFHLQAHHGKTNQVKVERFRRLAGANQSWAASLHIRIGHGRA